MKLKLIQVIGAALWTDREPVYCVNVSNVVLSY